MHCQEYYDLSITELPVLVADAVSQGIWQGGLSSRPAHLVLTGSCSRNEPEAPSMTFGGDASASESEVCSKCVSAMCLVRFAS